MGFDDGRIILNREDGTYHVGQIVSGKLEFDLSDTKTFRGIYVEFHGFCKVHWTTRHSRRQNDRTVHYTVTHESYEDYVNTFTYLAGSKHGEHQLHAGHHEFPFQFQIPPHCPSSFEAGNGHVRYVVKVTCDRAFKMDQHKKASVRVIAPTDLNLNPYCQEPIELDFHESYCCWCMDAGNSTVLVKVPYGGYCPRQVVPVEVACDNTSNVDISSIKFQICKKTVFHAEREPDTRTEEETVIQVKKGGVPARSERNWVVEMELPDMDVPNLDGCRFIDIEYKFKVDLQTSGCHEDDDLDRPIIIGTIPLSNSAPQPIGPTEVSPVAYQPKPIMNQPLPGTYAPGNGMNPTENNPYPPNSAYPGLNVPYPGSNASYLGSNAPYLGSNAPYPTSPSNAPYPTSPSISPYPSQNSSISSPYPVPPSNAPYPVPASNAPYPVPASNAPYPVPASNAPYPVTNVQSNAPYPVTNAQSNAPYPVNNAQSNAPYPVTNAQSNAPYPASNSPYPRSTSPYPATLAGTNNPSPSVTGSTLLKTGNFGFSAHGDGGAAMPLLPPSASVPYPTSPYASASAPTPSTPDDEGKKLTDENAANPPFNPEYKPEQK